MRLLVVALSALSLLAACGSNRPVREAPTDVQAMAGDGASLDGGDLDAGLEDIPPFDRPAPVDRPSTRDAVGDGGGAACVAMEVCGNGLDDNCDGVVDERCVCVPGERSSCYRGPARTRDVSRCVSGTMECAGSGEFGTWGPCTGDALPMEEVCDQGRVDEDCSGAANEDCECSVGAPPVPCGVAMGQCRAGTQSCRDGRLGACVGAVGPSPELCDNVDNDCDGVTDEELSRPCGVTAGACRQGIQRCMAGQWGVCTGGVMATPEVCEGSVDENCNGRVDEGCVCTRGATRPCGATVGVCRAGTQTCGADGQWATACVGAVLPSLERCDAMDNNCNGVVDEGCACTPGMTRSCYAGPTGTAGVGPCRAGMQRCEAGAMGAGSLWAACAGEVRPATEVCNRLDDDCDGMIDEGDVCPPIPPVATCPAAMSAVVGGTVTLTAMASAPSGDSLTVAWTVTARPAGSAAVPLTPAAASTQLRPDAAGVWTLQLCARDRRSMTCCTVTVNVVSACTPPVDSAPSTCATSWDRRPVVQFTPLPAGLIYEMWRAGDTAPFGIVSTPGQNYYRSSLPLAVGAPPPGSAVNLYVRTCRGADRSCCTQSAMMPVRLVEACVTPIAPTPTNVVFSEYLINGDGGACPGPACEAGEAIEITNLSHCPVLLNGYHFSYRNSGAGSYRWMNFTAEDVIPPRGVYVAVRNQAQTICPLPFFGPDDPGLFGLRISRLAMQGMSLDSGWFNNNGGGSSLLRIASGAFVDFTAGATVALVSPYRGGTAQCASVGFDAIGQCGEVTGGMMPIATLAPNQLGRLWHPCDAVRSPVPSACR